MSVHSRRKVPLMAAGGLSVVTGQLLLRVLIRTKLRRDVERLNAGDHRPILTAYASDAELAFDDGEHRWAGNHRGTVQIERFLSEIVRAGLQGRIREVWLSGPPWAMTLIVRFDDSATGPDGEVLYANRVVIVAQTRWGRITHQEDFYLDTRRIDAFESTLRAQGLEPSEGRVTRPALVYDADCGFCTRSARWLEDSGRDRFDVVAWQQLDLDATGLTTDQVTSVAYWLEDGRPVAAGSDAIGMALTRTRWRPIGHLVRTRRLRPLSQRVYRIVARNRHRMPGGNGTCEST